MHRLFIALSTFSLFIGLYTTSNAGAETLSAETLYQQASKARSDGQLDKAVELYSRVIKLEPEYVNAWLERSHIYDSRQQLKKADKGYRSVIAIMPDNDYAYGLLGWSLILQGDFDAAKAPALKAAALDPASPAWIFNVGHIDLLQGHEKSARQYYLQGLALIQDGSDYAEGIVADLNMFIQKGWQAKTCRRLLAWLETSNKQFQQSRLLAQQGRAFFQAKKYQQSVQTFQAALASYKQLPAAHPLMTAAMLDDLAGAQKKSGAFAIAAPLMEQSYALRKKALGAEHQHVVKAQINLAQFYYNWGASRYKQRQYQDAITTIKKAISIDEKRRPITVGYEHELIALNYKRLQKYQQAEEHLLQSIAILSKGHEENPELAKGQKKNLANLYFLWGQNLKKKKQYKPAIALLQQSLKLSEEIDNIIIRAFAHGELAASYEAMHQLDKAIQHLSENITLMKQQQEMTWMDLPEDISHLAGLYAASGDYKRSMPLYQEALMMRAKSPGWKNSHYLNVLEGIKNLYQHMGEQKKAQAIASLAAKVQSGTLKALPGTLNFSE